MTGFYNKPFFLKHKISNNIVVESYIGFILNNNLYYLKGDINEDNFETYKDKIKSYFGASNCTEEEELRKISCSSQTDPVEAGLDLLHNSMYVISPIENQTTIFACTIRLSDTTYSSCLTIDE